MPGIVLSLIVAALAFAGISLVALGRVGPDPAKWMLHEVGFYALCFLVLTLAVSPTSRFLHNPQLIRWRRACGLAGFFVASAHIASYALYQGWQWSAIANDIAKRPYIILGAIAWFFLLLLAATSFRGAQRRMGANWKRLHRAVYLLIPVAIVHQGMAQKADLHETALFSFVVACFLIERIWRVRASSAGGAN